MPTMESREAAVAIAYIAALNSRDADAIAAFVTDDFFNEHTSARGRTVRGREAYRERLDEFLSRFPVLHYSVEDIVVEGPKVVVAYRMQAEHAGQDGDGHCRSIDVRGVFRFLVRAGKIAHRVDYFDGITVEEQLGERP